MIINDGSHTHLSDGTIPKFIDWDKINLTQAVSIPDVISSKCDVKAIDISTVTARTIVAQPPPEGVSLPLSPGDGRNEGLPATAE